MVSAVISIRGRHKLLQKDWGQTVKFRKVSSYCLRILEQAGRNVLFP